MNAGFAHPFGGRTKHAVVRVGRPHAVARVLLVQVLHDRQRVPDREAVVHQHRHRARRADLRDGLPEGRALVDEQLDALAGRELAARMLGIDALLTASQLRSGPTPFKLGNIR